MMNTAFYRNTKNGNLKRIVENMSQKELRKELRNNGFIVVAIYKGNISYDEYDKKEFEF